MSVRVRVFLAMITIVAILAAVNLSIILFFIQRPLSMAVGGNISSAILPVEGSSRHIEPHSINAAAIFLAFGVLTAIIASGELSKPLMRMEKKNSLLDELSRTAASTSEAKSWFIANMRHEMRKPLNSVVRISEHMLGREGIRGEARDGIEKIHNAGMTILGIVNDILDISKIESQKFEIMPIEYDVPSLINDVVALNTVRAGDKPVEFNLHIDESLPCKLFGDELRVELICNNLLSNAFKYTRRGRIDLFLGCEKEGDNEWLTVRVADTGIGIRDEEMENLFSSRKRRHDEFSGKTDWTSLSITKMIVSMMGGTIMAKSEFGKGSIFTVSLRQGFVTDTPIGGDVAENLKRFHWSGNRRTENARPERARMFPPARVLVVDDVQANLDIAEELLGSCGMSVDCLTSGWQAVERIREGKIVYDAIFM
ncbi:MAG: hypothetical protein LBI74_01680, partial [Synergistaceae bacterium]|nr:hypothetical protein [Synergistaceae bacterium]